MINKWIESVFPVVRWDYSPQFLSFQNLLLRLTKKVALTRVLYNCNGNSISPVLPYFQSSILLCFYPLFLVVPGILLNECALVHVILCAYA